ncbi:MAG: ribonuclease H-like domain-containing protein [Lachnospiraceae bacterium]
MAIIMLTKHYQLEGFNINYPMHTIDIVSKILFIDIETTGLSPIDHSIYMIGLSYYQGNSWCVTQLFAENISEESLILKQLQDFLQGYDTIIHFNGNRFDLPFIQQRALLHNLSIDFDHMQGIDLYKRIYALRNLIVLPNYTQKTLEQYLGVNRKDRYTGRDLIKAYAQYHAMPSLPLLDMMYQHNLDDIKGLLYLVPILAYSELLKSTTKIKKVQMHTTQNFETDTVHELLLTLHTLTPLPRQITCCKNDCFLTASEHIVTIKVPVYHTELKYFYKNYKDYYYIKELDNAFHKSVSNFADRSILEQATAATCYTRKVSIYLRQFEQLTTPVYKKHYKDQESYFEITDDTRTDRELLKNYALHIIRMML